MSENGGGSRCALRTRSLLGGMPAVLVLAGCLVGPGPQAREGSDARPRAETPGEYIVSFRPGSDPAVVYAAFREYEVIELRQLVGPHHLMRLARDPGLDTIRSLAPPAIVAVQPNYEYRAE